MIKNHVALVLRAESASEKYAWLARLKHAATGDVRTPMRGYTSHELERGSVQPSESDAASEAGRQGGRSRRVRNTVEFLVPGHQGVLLHDDQILAF